VMGEGDNMADLDLFQVVVKHEMTMSSHVSVVSVSSL
jgi:hypothetical protein